MIHTVIKNTIALTVVRLWLLKGRYSSAPFAHKQSHVCSDTWANGGSHGYDLSPWHNEWQSLFPKVNQEVKLCLGETKHRADVLVDRTVIEFQHSIMPVKAFDDRNNFYFNLGSKCSRNSSL